MESEGNKKNMGILVSVIVPVYNVEKYLHRCIDSILKQTYSELEIILVDDGSTDSSGIICDQYKEIDERIIVVHQKNGGLSCARNTGLSIASGEYIGFVDSDDWLAENMYANLLYACTTSSADMAACKMIEVYSEEEIPPTDNVDHICLSQYEAIKAQIEKNDDIDINVSVCCKLFRKDIIKNLLFQNGVHYEDIMFSIVVLSRIDKCAYIASGLYFYRQNRDESITQNWLTERVFSDWIPILKQRIDYLRSIGYEELAITEEFYYLCHLIDIYFLIYESEKRKLYSNAEKIRKELLHNQKIKYYLINRKIGGSHKHYKTYKLKMLFAYLSPQIMYFVFHIIHKIREIWK